VKRRVPIVATIVVLAAVATMVGLGVWQLQRAQWKEGLLAQYRQAQAMSSNVPWPRDVAEREAALFRWSQFDCQRVLAVRSGAGTSADGQAGWAHTARCEIDGGEAEVALGWSKNPTQPLRWSGGEVSGIIGPRGVLQASMPPAGLQRLAPPDPNDLPNNHLMYAGQWFFFALTALVIYVLAVRKRWRQA
jgi:surfeit locus 1 family protein